MLSILYHFAYFASRLVMNSMTSIFFLSFSQFFSVFPISVCQSLRHLGTFAGWRCGSCRGSHRLCAAGGRSNPSAGAVYCGIPLWIHCGSRKLLMFCHFMLGFMFGFMLGLFINMLGIYIRSFECPSVLGDTTLEWDFNWQSHQDRSFNGSNLWTSWCALQIRPANHTASAYSHIRCIWKMNLYIYIYNML